MSAYTVIVTLPDTARLSIQQIMKESNGDSGGELEEHQSVAE